MVWVLSLPLLYTSSGAAWIDQPFLDASEIYPIVSVVRFGSFKSNLSGLYECRYLVAAVLGRNEENVGGHWALINMMVKDTKRTQQADGFGKYMSGGRVHPELEKRRLQTLIFTKRCTVWGHLTWTLLVLTNTLLSERAPDKGFSNCFLPTLPPAAPSLLRVIGGSWLSDMERGVVQWLSRSFPKEQFLSHPQSVCC